SSARASDTDSAVEIARETVAFVRFITSRTFSLNCVPLLCGYGTGERTNQRQNPTNRRHNAMFGFEGTQPYLLMCSAHHPTYWAERILLSEQLSWLLPSTLAIVLRKPLIISLPGMTFISRKRTTVFAIVSKSWWSASNRAICCRTAKSKVAVRDFFREF